MAIVTKTTSHAAMSYFLQSARPAPTPFDFLPPFAGIEELNLSIEDSLTLRTFEELIAEHHQAELPYYVAATTDTAGQVKFFDGASLMTSYFNYGHVKSPWSRLPFSQMRIYECKPHEKQFKEFCNFRELLAQNEHYAKFLMASEPSLSAQVRGPCRYYVGGHYEFKEQAFQKAEIWYKKASEDNYFAVHLVFAKWYENGILYSPSRDKALKEYKCAYELLSSSTNLSSSTDPDPALVKLAAELLEKIKNYSIRAN